MKRKEKEKIRLRIYENKVKNMSKEEFVKELKNVSDSNNIFLCVFCLCYGVDISMLYSILTCESNDSQIGALVGFIFSSIIAFASTYASTDYQGKKKNKLEILYKYVDKDDKEKEKDNTKTLNS